MGRHENAGYRTIPIGPMLVRSLKAWKLRCPPSPLDLMFPATRRDRRWSSDRAALGYGPIKQGALSDLFLKVQIEGGLALDTGRVDAKRKTIWKSRYGWHDLRHVAASNWLNDGIDLKRLQTWIGHENIQLTIDVYGHPMRRKMPPSPRVPKRLSSHKEPHGNRRRAAARLKGEDGPAEHANGS